MPLITWVLGSSNDSGIEYLENALTLLALFSYHGPEGPFSDAMWVSIYFKKYIKKKSKKSKSKRSQFFGFHPFKFYSLKLLLKQYFIVSFLLKCLKKYIPLQITKSKTILTFFSILLFSCFIFLFIIHLFISSINTGFFYSYI